MPVSEETQEFLEQVKKGKPKKFVMLTKGTEVISLVVFKKGSNSKYIKQAKEEGKGIPCFGVVDGRGMDITFKLAKADGFDKAPVKSMSLKTFLEEADFKCKPLIEIVESSPLVLDEDDPLVTRFIKLQDAAIQACDANPDKADEINSLCRQIGVHFDQDQVDDSKAKLDQLEKLLGSVAGKTTTPPPSIDVAAKTKLIDALNKIKPLVDKAAALHPQRQTELQTALGKAYSEIENNRLNQAQTEIVTLGKLAQTLLAAPPIAPPNPSVTPNNPAVKFNERLKALLPAIKAVAGTPQGDEAKLRAAEAGVAVRKSDFAQANALLDQVEAVLKSNTASPNTNNSQDAARASQDFASSEPVPEPSSPNSNVADAFAQRWQQAKETWQDAIDTVNAQLESLRSTISKINADDNPELSYLLPQLEEIANTGLSYILDGHRVALQIAFTNVDQAADADRAKFIAVALKLVNETRTHIATDERIEVCDDNGMEVTVSIRDEMEKALSQLNETLSNATAT